MMSCGFGCSPQPCDDVSGLGVGVRLRIRACLGLSGRDDGARLCRCSCCIRLGFSSCLRRMLPRCVA